MLQEHTLAEQLPLGELHTHSARSLLRTQKQVEILVYTLKMPRTDTEEEKKKHSRFLKSKDECELFYKRRERERD